MANYVQIKDGNGNLVDVEAEALNDGLGDTVYRQGVYIGSPSTFGRIAEVPNQDPGQTDNGLTVRPVRSSVLTYHAVAQTGLNAVNISATGRVVYGWSIFNDANYPVYVKLFDKGSTPVPGSDSPVQTIGIQAGVSREIYVDRGLSGYSLGLGIAITKGISDLDATPISANDCVVDVMFL